jgi:hypothetical protein
MGSSLLRTVAFGVQRVQFDRAAYAKNEGLGCYYYIIIIIRVVYVVYKSAAGRTWFSRTPLAYVGPAASWLRW